MKIIYPNRDTRDTCYVMILEKGDYNLHLDRFKGHRVNNIFIPEDEYHLYDKEHLSQLHNCITSGEIQFGQILTYKRQT